VVESKIVRKPTARAKTKLKADIENRCMIVQSEGGTPILGENADIVACNANTSTFLLCDNDVDAFLSSMRKFVRENKSTSMTLSGLMKLGMGMESIKDRAKATAIEVPIQSLVSKINQHKDISVILDGAIKNTWNMSGSYLEMALDNFEDDIGDFSADQVEAMSELAFGKKLTEEELDAMDDDEVEAMFNERMKFMMELVDDPKDKSARTNLEKQVIDAFESMGL